MPLPIKREVEELPYPHNLLRKLRLALEYYPVSDEFLEAFEYELISADADREKKNFCMLMMYYSQACLLADIGVKYHISRQAVRVRIQKMIDRLCHPTRIRRIEELVQEENLRWERKIEKRRKREEKKKETVCRTETE